MIILISSKIRSANIQASLGKPEYSYFFLMKDFLPALERAGTVIVVDDPIQIDSLYAQYIEQGEKVVYLSFGPPHQTSLGLRCPTFCVFAWEFDSIPDEAWDDDPRHDWRYVFARIAGAIALSQEAANAVTKAMGASYPVIALPAPLWDRHALGSDSGLLPQLNVRRLSFNGQTLDSPLLGLSADGLAQPNEPVRNPLPSITPPLTGWALRWATTRALAKGWWSEAILPFLPQSIAEPVVTPRTDPKAVPIETIAASDKLLSTPKLLKLSGVVYTSVLNPEDGRKNWIDLISAFCWAFKNEVNATLIVKMVHADIESYRTQVMTHLSRLAPFKCRVVIVHGYLTDAEYKDLIKASTFYVNSSACEGLCLPLVEYLCSGRPAISPLHTAMLDYITEKLAVLVKCSIEPASFLHDPANRLRTRRYRQSWDSLVMAYQRSYIIATEEPERYRQMSSDARTELKEFCSVERVSKKLDKFLANNLNGLDDFGSRERQA
ncbi:glycosyltransferase [Serpens gallinarum]|uniref:Glycosyltransferase n=1 Tax=Serpens gallinarum TaxID=2763075 RepID=A0ABR8TP13_9PSED|nr:glycosyltransferase [Serpens gallinarum]MBD7977404.1 glycosyltransferase [Serpens gallinarum]